MPGRSNSSARVVIMDDISWSEPAPRSRSAAAELDAPRWMRSEAPEPEPGRREDRRRPDSYREDVRPRAVEYQNGVEHRDHIGQGWNADFAQFIDEPEVLEYVDTPDEEAVWGPRPKLLSSEPGGRRTVVITGRVADRHVAPRAAARGGAPVHARHGFQADRTAMWAVLLCVILLLAAVASH